MLKIKQTKQFKKDLKTAFRQGCDLARLEEVIDTLAAEQPLLELEAQDDVQVVGHLVGLGADICRVDQ